MTKTKTTDMDKDDTIEVAQLIDNVIQPFQLEVSSLRGRVVRLGSTLDDILTAHDYPKPVAHLVAEIATLALLLSSMLKYDGIFTLQTKGDGPINMLVADVTSDGKVRACATFDEERVETARAHLSALKTPEGSDHHLAQFLGAGYIAFTVDQGEHMERYQGIVELQGASLVDSVRHYFNQSEQIGAAVKMAVGQRDGKWRGSGVMLQHMPEDDKNPALGETNLDEDDWRRAMILLDSCTEDEFLDPQLDHNSLLMRLFHEEGVRVYAPIMATKECRCSAERVENMLLMMPAEDREYMHENGEISMRCEFCGTDYAFDFAAIERRVKDNENTSS